MTSERIDRGTRGSECGFPGGSENSLRHGNHSHYGVFIPMYTVYISNMEISSVNIENFRQQLYDKLFDHEIIWIILLTFMGSTFVKDFNMWIAVNNEYFIATINTKMGTDN